MITDTGRAPSRDRHKRSDPRPDHVYDAMTWALGLPEPRTLASRHIGAARIKIVLIGLCSFVDRDGFAYPSTQGLADATGLTRRDVRNALDQLAEHDLIKREDGIAGSTVTYRVNLPAAARASADDSPPATPEQIREIRASAQLNGSTR